jgi:nicotinamidase-related amidase
MVRSESALLVIDMQHGLFYGQPAPQAAGSVLANIRQLIEKAKQAGAPVFFARHIGPDNSPFCEQGPLTQLIPELEVDADKDVIFTKRFPSCFRDTELQQQLKQKGIKRLIIAGMKTEFCVDTTCRAAAEQGFAAVLIPDAHTTVDNGYFSAQQIIDHHNKTLSGPFVTLATTTDVQFAADK